MKSTSSNKVFVFLVLAVFIISCQNQTPKENTSDQTKSSEEWLSLFNGEDLNGWYTYQKSPEPTSEVPGLGRDGDGNYLEAIGLNKDPLKVFTVVMEDDEPAIRMSGEVFGIIVTDKEFENYHLKLEFKWGDEKWPPRKNEKMDSGILYHSIGAEGAWGGVWMKSMECQVQQTDCGDYISVDTVLADVTAFKSEENGRYYYKPSAETLTFSPERSYCNKSEDFENPTGEWNTMEIYTVNGKSIHVVNGKVNMRVSNSRYLIDGNEVPLIKGKIQLQSEGAEIFYRNINLKAIEEIPQEILKP
ncbi:MAG: DUF1080 domain-containing protein [Bacteroidales bacterium]|nr:DUF1080 domain-containing protein [Bacteroidales bacterium]